MAHFAEINENNEVVRVLVVDNSQEHRGQEFLAIDCNLGGIWIQTSYNSNIRGKFAGIGDIYDDINDRFISAKPFSSWTFDELSYNWMPPVQRPNDEKQYRWVEEDLNWQVIE